MDIYHPKLLRYVTVDAASCRFNPAPAVFISAGAACIPNLNPPSNLLT